MNNLGVVGVIGRFKPLHNGGVVMLETLCEQAEHVKIGIGSCNKYNVRNPFTAEESKAMIDAVLSPKYSNYSFIFVPDFAHIPKYSNGERWVQEIVKQYGTLDTFISGDAYVTELLKDHYKVIHPASVVPEDKKVRLRATTVRLLMAQGDDDWKQLVSKPVADYLENNGLVDRFRREFGLETLAQLAGRADYNVSEDVRAEKCHTMEA
jgi:nicotinamide mononucleotide adenylyltransferase